MYGFSCPRCFVALNPFGICPSCGWRPIPTAGLSDTGAAAWRERALVAESCLKASEARRRELEAILTTCCDELNEVGNASFWKLWPTSTPMGDVQAMIRAARAAIDAAMESEGKDKEEQP